MANDGQQRLKRFSVALALLALGACSGAMAPLPMTSVGTSGEVMRGSLIPSMDFSGTFTLATDDGSLRCEGATRRDGTGTMTCTDGRSVALAIPRPPYGRFSGSYVETFGTDTVAIGWGSEADEASLRAQLPQGVR